MQEGYCLHMFWYEERKMHSVVASISTLADSLRAFKKKFGEDAVPSIHITRTGRMWLVTVNGNSKIWGKIHVTPQTCPSGWINTVIMHEEVVP